MTATWSNSRPFVACAVARVSGASSRRRSASRARVSRTRGREGLEVGGSDRPAEHRRRDLARRRSPRTAAPNARRSSRGATRPACAAAAARSSRSSTSGDSSEQVDPRGAEREPEPERDDDGREQLAVGPRQDRAGRTVVRPGADDALDADDLVRRVRPRGRAGRSPPGRRGSTWRTARRCARRGGRRARPPSVGSGS